MYLPESNWHPLLGLLCDLTVECNLLLAIGLCKSDHYEEIGVEVVVVEGRHGRLGRGTLADQDAVAGVTLDQCLPVE